MKWGIRRYQNADGSLTNAGKKRYNSKASVISNESKKKFQLTDKQKKVLKIGGIIVGNLALSAVAYKLTTNPKIRASAYKILYRNKSTKVDPLYRDVGEAYINILLSDRLYGPLAPKALPAAK